MIVFHGSMLFWLSCLKDLFVLSFYGLVFCSHRFFFWKNCNTRHSLMLRVDPLLSYQFYVLVVILDHQGLTQWKEVEMCLTLETE